MSKKTTHSHYRDGKKSLVFTEKKGAALDTCATINNKYICCNVKVLKAVSNCPFDCSYCFLQNYLNSGQLSVVKDTQALMDEVTEKIFQEPNRLFRIGTWELGDSLALEQETGQAGKLIQAFSKLDNVILELKTKSDVVEPILSLDHQHKTVLSWSLSTEYLIKKEEHKTASLENRLLAIQKASKADYLLGFHFDPMIFYQDWEEGYKDLIERLFQVCKPEQIAWISIGSLRFNPEQKGLMESNFPGSALNQIEMVKGDDNKLRYVKPIRIEMYRKLLSYLHQFGSKNLYIYLCMERWDIWESVLGYSPKSIADLDYQFAESIWKRFPKICKNKPDPSYYPYDGGF